MAENPWGYCIALMDNLRRLAFRLHEEDFVDFVLVFFFKLKPNQHAEIGAEKVQITSLNQYNEEKK